MKKATISVIAQYGFDKDQRVTAVLHATELIDGAGAYLAAKRTWKQNVQDCARRLLESGVAGPDTFESRKEIARFIPEIIAAEYPGQISGAAISLYLTEIDFRVKAARADSSKGGSTAKSNEEKIAAYLGDFDYATIKKALKVMGYAVTKA